MVDGASLYNVMKPSIEGQNAANGIPQTPADDRTITLVLDGRSVPIPVSDIKYALDCLQLPLQSDSLEFGAKLVFATGAYRTLGAVQSVAGEDQRYIKEHINAFQHVVAYCASKYMETKNAGYLIVAIKLSLKAGGSPDMSWTAVTGSDIDNIQNLLFPSKAAPAASEEPSTGGVTFEERKEISQSVAQLFASMPADAALGEILKCVGCIPGNGFSDLKTLYGDFARTWKTLHK